MVKMTLQPMYDSPDKNKRKIIEWVCSETGRCFSVNEVSFTGSTSTKNGKPVNRINRELELSEILLGY